MKRPSKKEIREMVEKLKDKKPESPTVEDFGAAKPEDKKANKNRIRKKGV
ncbi:MAG: hypothetical protein QOJ65_2744 [Fimbriimonadaceae bacterium]|jgi:hypothetical protein|nr:hypothetical protein [Fimbriimonadaceae bacterium]